jgi:uncharacterized protein YgbK (DUF1537 family)
MKLGCIGDDFTGSSDLANTLAKGGLSVMQFNGVPAAPAPLGVAAGVVALKTRTAPVAEAVAQSLAALDWLRAQGCTRFLFKYCSTFDSTPQGNIGPVLDALAEALDARAVVVCPAFPETGRTVYQGHLFVNDRLLSESGMERHPLTPMSDPDIRRVLAPQTVRPVRHVPQAVVAAGPDAIRAALDAAADAGACHVVVDASCKNDLIAIGQATATDALISGGSGIALALPGILRAEGAAGDAGGWQGATGSVAALCGSCSTASQTQIARHEAAGHPVFRVDAETILSGDVDVEGMADRVMAAQRAGAVPLVCSTADPATVAAAQARLGRERAASAIEGFMGALARALVARGVTRLVVAGGETSGAVVSALALPAFAIGPEIDPGVPALRAGKLALTLKSGNFGRPTFFAHAAAVLEGPA